MRKPFIAANWKMHKNRDEALKFIYAVSPQIKDYDNVETCIFAPSILLRCLVKRKGDNLQIGAQNMHYEESGAYTGELSANMIKSTKVDYVLIGHSERRAMFNETDETVNKKIKQALKHELKVILCVGESLEQRDASKTVEVITSQVEKALAGIKAEGMKDITIAYEPIWAIGTGKTATKEDANQSCKEIRGKLQSLYSKEVAESTRIQYGGSVKTSNIKELMEMEHIDGALVGGASLDEKDFISLVNYNK